MARRKILTDHMVAKLKPGPKRLTLSDPEVRGHYVRCTPTGAKSYVAVARGPGGKQVWATIGGADVLTIDEAREKAREAIKRIRGGLTPFEPPPVRPDSFKAVAENYIKRHVAPKGLRSQAEIERNLKRYIYPTWADREFDSIRRSDVAKLLDDIQDANGPSQADHILSVVRGIMNWHASRSDDYVVPIARGMRRTDPAERKRARILDDDEIRAVWSTAEHAGTFGAILRLALLTAQRREKLATMCWDDVTDGVWNIPTEKREKGNAGALVLPELALDIIRSQKRIGKNPYVFAGRGDSHFQGFSPCKRTFDDRVTAALREAATGRGDDPDDAAPLPRWTLHDLRRTARSLMARTGVRPDIGERVMGHVIQGIEGIYDRHSYRAEKADALNKLAGLIALILSPPADNVTELHAEA